METENALIGVNVGACDCISTAPIASIQKAAERAGLLPETVGVPLHAGRNKVVFLLRQKMIQWMDC